MTAPPSDAAVPMDSAGSTGGAGGMPGADAKDTGSSGGGADAADGSLQPFPCSPVVPSGPEITDFSGTDPMGTWGDLTEFGGGVYSYGGMSDGGTDLTGAVDLVAHTYRVTGQVTTYSGFGLYFNRCTDASRYRGISFKLSGTIGGGALRFVPTVNETTPIDPVNMVGSCRFMNEQTKFVECVNPATTITASGSVTVLWRQLSGGKPRDSVNPAELRGLQWVLVWAPGLSYAVDLTLDDVAFVTDVDGATDASNETLDASATDSTQSGDASPD
jgi:hypothetical protein